MGKVKRQYIQMEYHSILLHHLSKKQEQQGMCLYGCVKLINRKWESLMNAVAQTAKKQKDEPDNQTIHL